MRTLSFAICALFTAVANASSDEDYDTPWNPLDLVEDNIAEYSRKLHEIPFDPYRDPEEDQIILEYIIKEREGKAHWVNTGTPEEKAAQKQKELAAAENKKLPVTLEIPMDEQFPEMATTEDEQAQLDALKDPSIDNRSKQGIHEAYQKSVGNKFNAMTMWRQQELNHYNQMVAERDHGEKFRDFFACYHANTFKGSFNSDKMWVDKTWATQNAGYKLDLARYRKYISNMPKTDSRPWLLIFMKTPYQYAASDYWNQELNLNQMFCVAQVFEMNVGILDYNKSELIQQSFQYYTEGTYGQMSPNYMIVKDQHAYHMKKQNYQQPMEAIQDAEYIMNGTAKEHGLNDEPLRAPCNGLNIYWEYIKRDIGKKWANYLLIVIIRDKLSCNDGNKTYHPKECWLFWEAEKYLGEHLVEKEKGMNMIKYLLAPLLLVLLTMLHFISRCCCGTGEVFDEESDDETEDNKVAEETKTKASPKGKGGKHKKME